MVIISPRRYGKTSLVFQVLGRLRRQDVLVAYLDLLSTPTKDRLADRLADAIYGGLVAPLDRARRRAVEMFQKLPIRPKITVGSDGSPSFEFSATDSGQDVDRTLEELLKVPGEIARSRRRRVALVLDEFQEIVHIAPELPGLMRAVFQLQVEVAHVFLGSRRHLMERVFTEENQPMYRLAKPLPLGEIGAGPFAAFIRERFSATKLGIDEEAIGRILAITGGHPHDTQELCYFAWSLAKAEEAEATPALVDRALEEVIDAENSRFTVLWEGLPPHQRLVLTALVADGGRGVFSEAYRRGNRLGAASSVQKSLARLRERELIEPTSGTSPAAYRVPDVFLRAWLARLLRPRGYPSPRR